LRAQEEEEDQDKELEEKETRSRKSRRSKRRGEEVQGAGQPEEWDYYQKYMKLDCPWLVPPGRPSGVEMGEAAYNELFFEAAQRAWSRAEVRFPGRATWPAAGIIGLVAGKIVQKWELARYMKMGVMELEEAAEMIAGGILDFLQML